MKITGCIGAKVSIIFVIGLLISGYSQANVEDPFVKQIEKEKQLQKNNESQRSVRIDIDQSNAQSLIIQNETPCFVINSLQLDAEQAEHFRFAIQPLISGKQSILGHCLGIQGVNKVVSSVQNNVIKAGYVTTRILVDSQDLRSHRLALRVVPGKISSIKMNHIDSKGHSHHAALFNSMPMSQGDVLNLRDLEQGLENLKRPPTSDADIQLLPSQTLGYSDIQVKYQQKVPLRATFSIDDSGSKSTGKYLASGSFSYDNMLTLNDIFSFTYGENIGGAQLPGTHRNNSQSYYYSIPWGYWSLSTTVSEYDYRQTVIGSTQDYIYSGHSQSNEMSLSRVLLRDSKSKLTANIGLFVRASSNAIDDTEIDVQRRKEAGWLAGISYRYYLANATWDSSLTYKQGTGMFGSIPAPEETYDEGSSHPEFISGQSSIHLPFDLYQQHLYWQPEIRVQQNFINLTPQDRFAIGGRYTVRGFDGENILSGDRGVLIRNEFGLQVMNQPSFVYLGTDYGLVNGDSTGTLVGRSLAGGVIGLKGEVYHFNYDLFAGIPLYKPDGFRTSNTVAGFNISYSI